VTWKNPSTNDTSCGNGTTPCPWPVIAHSCTATDGRFADPAVRIAQAVNGFGTNGFMSSICDANFGPALQSIANRIGGLLAAGGGAAITPGAIPSCSSGGSGGGGGASGAGGTTGGGGTMATGGTTGGGGTGMMQADAGADAGRAKGGGGWCQIGGAASGGAASVWLAGLFMVLAARRKARRGAARRR
jgi:hypothetical protein